MQFDQCENFLDAERLAQEGAHGCPRRPLSRGHPVRCRHDNDWQFSAPIDLTALRYEFQSVHDWHHEIENNDVGLGQPQLLERLLAVRGLGDQIAFVGKYLAQEPSNGGFIIDDEYPPDRCWVSHLDLAVTVNSETPVHVHHFARISVARRRAPVMNFCHSGLGAERGDDEPRSENESLR